MSEDVESNSVNSKDGITDGSENVNLKIDKEEQQKCCTKRLFLTILLYIVIIVVAFTILGFIISYVTSNTSGTF